MQRTEVISYSNATYNYPPPSIIKTDTFVDNRLKNATISKVVFDFYIVMERNRTYSLNNRTAHIDVYVYLKNSSNELTYLLYHYNDERYLYMSTDLNESIIFYSLVFYNQTFQTSDLTDVVMVKAGAFGLDYYYKICYSLRVYLTYTYRPPEIPILSSMIELIPIISILFTLSIALYLKFGSTGFVIGLILSTIIAIISNMITIFQSTMLFIIEFAIIYFLKKRSETGWVF